jgi:hypothetical protein
MFSDTSPWVVMEQIEVLKPVFPCWGVTIIRKKKQPWFSALMSPHWGYWFATLKKGIFEAQKIADIYKRPGSFGQENIELQEYAGKLC